MQGNQTYATFEEWWLGSEARRLYVEAEYVREICQAAFEAGYVSAVRNHDAAMGLERAESL